MHIEPLHVPEVHVPPVQQGSPVKPHRVHCAEPDWVVHTTSLAVHVLPGQHGSPSLPHVVQKPPEVAQICVMVPTGEQVPPTATHVEGIAEVSQQPLVQVSLQHG